MGQSGSRDVLLDAAQRRLGTHGSAAEKVWEGISHVRNGQHDGKAVHAIPAEALAAHLGLEAAACQRLIAGAAQDLLPATRALDLSPREEDQIVLPPTTADLLSPEAAFIINANLAGPLQNQWHLLYSSARDGSSFATFSGRITQAGATVLVFRDKQGHVFGGFAPESWSVQPQFFGSNATFLFKLEPELRLYEASGLNDHFMYMNQGMKTMPNGLGFGGQLNYFALYVDAALTNGHSKGKPSTTFKSPSLAASEDFVIDACEAWRVGPSPEQAAGQKSILDGRHEEEALLEMAGRTLHSKQLREPHPEDDE
ncbi:uncharacterized protein MONBRDRAFT_11311 [Monosiga brevicollis MX1]|uniref:MTOR-associated protein MEAK7 n=1 Tax=Monosiga brevicollis TaxID=81824 RepID=A9V8V1_MONBE|nr:uncharacterized protein MONBRDRAFT_11311 [Monosiga brevicollis MX1]EDQ85937.1 predicted protein [Monosiga brevicollis MX1]|eukprot:XP_001749131.1 hypothetical protein [Monosiga brevicollis MX1]